MSLLLAAVVLGYSFFKHNLQGCFCVPFLSCSLLNYHRNCSSCHFSSFLYYFLWLTVTGCHAFCFAQFLSLLTKFQIYRHVFWLTHPSCATVASCFILNTFPKDVQRALVSSFSRTRRSTSSLKGEFCLVAAKWLLWSMSSIVLLLSGFKKRWHTILLKKTIKTFFT